MDVEKLAETQFLAFCDELEKIAGLNAEEIELLKEAFLENARAALRGSVRSVGNALESRGATGVGRVLHAMNAPIETGAAGHLLHDAGHHLQETATKGVLGGLQHGIGEAIAHKGHALQGGGAKALGRAAWDVVNPVGTAAEVGLTGAGHAASRAMKLNPTGKMHGVLTKALPKAGEIGGSALTGLAVGAPVGVAGLLGHHALSGVASLAPGAAELAGHAVHGLGEGGGELAHHLGADVLGSSGALRRGVGTLGSLGGRAVAALRNASV